MYKPKHSNDSPIKFKIVIGFILGILAIGLAGYVVFQSTSKLRKSVNTLAKPDKEIRLLNDILIDLSGLETINRSYQNHKDDSLILQKMTQVLKRVKEKFRELEQITLNPEHKKRIDEIQHLLRNIPKSTKEFITLKGELEGVNFSDKAKEVIYRHVPQYGELEADSTILFRDTITIQYTYSRIKRIAQETKKIVEEEKSNRENAKGGFLSGLFRKKDPQEKKEKRERRARRREKNREKNRKKDKEQLAQEEDELYKLEPNLQIPPPPIEAKLKDTIPQLDNKVISRESDVLKGINHILQDLALEEEGLKDEINMLEEELVTSNSALINHIRNMLEELQEEAFNKSSQKQKEAEQTAHQTTVIISLIMAISVLLALLFMLMILSDITRSNYYKRKLYQAKKEAENHAQEKETFLANMSHEIRTPLHAILGFSEQLLKANPPEELLESTEAIDASSRHLLVLVNDVLDLSKIEARKLNLEHIDFSLSTLLHETQQTFREQAQSKGLDFQIIAENIEGVVLKGDPHRLKQVLFNLVSNALKFTEAGKVWIKASIDRKTKNRLPVHLQVEDTGIGMTEAQQQKLFEKFYQADASVSRKYGGTGLGLVISQKIVHTMNGRFYIKSHHGEGSLFRIELQLEEGRAENVPVPHQLALTSHQFDRAYRVLLVDDDTLNRKLGSKLLSNFGLDPQTASNGLEALEIFNQEAFDMVLLDMQMPEMSGGEVIQHIRKLPDTEKAATPIVVLTANIVVKDREKMLEYGAQGFLNKPYREAELFQTLAQFLQASQEVRDDETSSNEPLTSCTMLYNLDSINQFTMGDETLRQEVIQEFIQETEENLSQLENLLHQQDWPEIQELTHRMYSRFAQFEINHLAPLIREVEMTIKQGKSTQNLPAIIQEILAKAPQVLSEMREQEVVG